MARLIPTLDNLRERNAVYKNMLDEYIPKKKLYDEQKKLSDEQQTIAKYESIPEYNLVERALSGDKSQAYNEKQSMLGAYQEAKNNQITRALQNYTPQSDETIPMLAGVNANELLHPFKYEAAQKEIQPYLEANNITLDQLEEYYRTQALEAQNRQSEQYAKDHPVLGTLGTLATNQIGNMNTLAQGVNDYITGRPIGSNQALNAYGQLTGNVRGALQNQIKENANSKLGGNVGAMAYDVATGLGDMGMSMALTGFNPNASLALMSANSAGGSLNEQIGKNTTAAQKIGTAALSGAIEAVTEKIPLDNLFKMAKTPAGQRTIKTVLGGIMKQAGQEATEEGVSEIANSLIDWAINRGESDYEKSVAAYMAQGENEQQARNKARTDVALNAGYAALVGGLSGGVMGGIASGVGARNAQSNIENSNNGNLVQDSKIPVLNDEQSTNKIPQREQTVPTIADIADRVRRLENPDFVRTETQPETVADRVRRVESETPLKTRAQYIGDNPFVPGDMSLDEIIESNAQKNAPNIQAAQEQLAKPYNSNSVDGMKEFSEGMKNLVNMFGNNEVKSSYYPQLVSLLNEYQQTGDTAKYNEAADLAAFIDKQMNGKTYTNKRGQSYDFTTDSFYDEFANGYDAFNKMYLDRKNAVPSLKKENATQSNYDDALWERDMEQAKTMPLDEEQQEIPVLENPKNKTKKRYKKKRSNG